MKRGSIFFSITLTFVISIFIIIASFFLFLKANQKRQELFLKRKFTTLTHIVMRNVRFNHSKSDLKEELKSFNFSLIEDINSLNHIPKKLIFTNSHRFARVKLFLIQKYHYLYIYTPRGEFLLKDNSKVIRNQVIIISVFGTILSLFVLLFFTTIKKLNLIKELKNKIINLGDGDLNIDSATNKNDEISELLNEFDKSVKKLKKFRESRNVFIRNIMHELKTPITKGKIITELPKTKENEEKLKKVFYRMESLISEFASIEELISIEKKPKIREYFLADIIDNAKDLLLVEDEKVVEELTDEVVKVNFKLFSIAIKNLMDNAIKYSNDSKVTIKTENSKIIFENRGDGLKHPLKEYFEPFFKDDELNQSFGLGLYIVKHILDANEYKIEYEYEDGINRFMLGNK